MCQLILTGCFIAVFTFSKPVRDFTKQSPWLYLVALSVLIVS
jgi:FtsH-binding integral membrane protein